MAAAMTITIGSVLRTYEILSELGKGGMGEVWRARDSKLGREVAIKTLPPGFTSDAERLVRFEREARVLASLNHPNIASIYGLEESDGVRFLVMELVEGETLADRLNRGSIPVEEALKLGLQTATAIEAAHEKGVVHRDLKPANIKITPEGKVKVLDFGLAKALLTEAQDISNSPTISMAATARGVIMGTAAYMSPEQARGTAVDNRSDIWAFGCVLYEMLSGHRAFAGDTVSDLLASVLARDPDFAAMRTRVNPRLEETVQRCLEKDPKRRWQAIGDVRMELERLLVSGTLQAPVTPTEVVRPRWIWPAIAAVMVISAAAAWFLKPTPVDPKPVARFEYIVPEGQSFRNAGRPVVAFSPDGRHFVYNTVRGLFIRSLDTLDAHLIPGTEAVGLNPFFSPNGEWVGYFELASAELRKIAITGGAPVTITRAAPTAFGASWGPDGNILFGQTEGIMRVSENGGQPELVVKAKEGETVYGPSLLPDGETILYSLTRAGGTARWDQGEILAKRKDSEPKVLIRGGSDAQYVPTGHLVYAVNNVLFAVPFDAKTLDVRGGPAPIVTDLQRAVATTTNTASANYGFSKNGTLVYLKGLQAATTAPQVPAIVDRSGLVRRLNVPAADYRHPRVSPDGKSLTIETVTDTEQSIVWVYDLSGKTSIRRLTQEGNNTRPIWTADGKRIVYGSDREKPQGIFWQAADGSSLPERLTSAEDGVLHYPESWSKQNVLSFASVRVPIGGSSWGIWTLAVDDKARKPALFYDLPRANDFGSVFSPDGKWIAYASNNNGSNDSNQFGIYVQPYPPAGGVKYEISRSGGAWPVWSAGGSELFYRLNVGEANSQIRAVTISTSPTPSFKSEQELPIRGFTQVTNYRDYDPLPNGQGFVMIYPLNSQSSTTAPAMRQINIVQNWFEELKARVPVH